jgi:membrane protease YdiL (CAAX protease family)
MAPLAGPWTLAEGAAIVALTFMLTLAAAVVAGADWLPQGGGATGDALRLASLATVPYVVALAVAYGMSRRHGYTLSQGFGIRRTSVLTGTLLAVGIALLGRVFASAWTGLLAALGLEPPANLDVTSWFPSDPLGLSLLFLLTVVVAPVVEEVVYRGVLYPALRLRVGLVPAVLFSALAFGIAHISLVWLLVPMTFFGALLALAFEGSRSLVVPIASHALFNLMAVLVVLALAQAGMG